MGKLLLFTGLVLAAGVALYFSCGKCNSKPADYSSFRADGWFGKKSLKAGEAIPKDSTDIRPFKVNISDADLNDLNTRLAKSRFVDHIEGTQFNYGFRSTYLKQVVEYWRTKYDWRKEEAKLNSYPQFKTTIEGIDIHFVHIKPTKPAKTVIPLLTIHGWPGSFLEYYKSFPLLTEPDQNGVAFEVIAPSIPGYGYSEAAHQKGNKIVLICPVDNVHLRFINCFIDRFWRQRCRPSVYQADETTGSREICFPRRRLGISHHENNCRSLPRKVSNQLHRLCGVKRDHHLA